MCIHLCKGIILVTLSIFDLHCTNNTTYEEQSQSPKTKFSSTRSKRWAFICLQVISEQFISETMDSCWALVRFNVHDNPLKEFKGVLHVAWVLEVKAVDCTHQHGKACGHIFEVMNDNCLLYHHSHIKDFQRKRIMERAFVSNKQSNLHSFHYHIEGFSMDLMTKTYTSQLTSPVCNLKNAKQQYTKLLLVNVRYKQPQNKLVFVVPLSKSSHYFVLVYHWSNFVFIYLFF